MTIATSAPVTITNSVIKGTGKLVANSASNVKLTIDHTSLHGLYPGGSGRWGDYAVRLSGFDFLHFEHNYLEQKGGVKLVDWTGSVSANPVLVRYNLAKNIDGRVTDGAGGYSGSVITQFLQLDNVQNAGGIDVSWNEIHNTPDASAVEDNINIFESSGSQSSPIDIHDNFIDGAYPYPALSVPFRGGGILLADSGGNFQVAHDNQVVSTTNYGLANASGTNTRIYQNRAVSSGLLADGTRIPSANVGLYSWNQYAAPYGNNSVYNNIAGWMQKWNDTPRRNDLWVPDCNDVCTGNAHLGGNVPITRVDEANEFAMWQQKLQDMALTVGP